MNGEWTTVMNSVETVKSVWNSIHLLQLLKGYLLFKLWFRVRVWRFEYWTSLEKHYLMKLMYEQLWSESALLTLLSHCALLQSCLSTNLWSLEAGTRHFDWRMMTLVSFNNILQLCILCAYCVMLNLTIDPIEIKSYHLLPLPFAQHPTKTFTSTQPLLELILYTFSSILYIILTHSPKRSRMLMPPSM